MVRAEKSLQQQYKPSLTGMMSFKDGINYLPTYDFSKLELAKVVPEDIVRWMCLKVYGTPDPTHDANPTLGRSTSIAYAKKAISYFMPNKLMQWNEMTDPPVGNPTKSAAVNDLIKLVKMKEV